MHVSQILRSCICFRISRTFFIHVFSCMYLYMYMYVRTYVYPVCYSNDYEYSPHIAKLTTHICCMLRIHFVVKHFSPFFLCMCVYVYVYVRVWKWIGVENVQLRASTGYLYTYIQKGKRTNSKGNRIRVECKILLPHHKIHEWIFCVYKIVRKSIIKGDAQPGVESKAFYGWSR